MGTSGGRLAEHLQRPFPGNGVVYGSTVPHEVNPTLDHCSSEADVISSPGEIASQLNQGQPDGSADARFSQAICDIAYAMEDNDDQLTLQFFLDINQ